MKESTRSLVTWAAMIVVILNLVDAIFTLAYTSAGLATEANPIMDFALAKSPVVFMVFKLAIVSGGVFVLWRLRHRRAAAFGMMSSTAVYCSLLVYHLTAAHQLVAFSR